MMWWILFYQKRKHLILIGLTQNSIDKAKKLTRKTINAAKNELLLILVRRAKKCINYLQKIMQSNEWKSTEKIQ